MEIAKLVLEYIKVLIWPSVTLFLCIYLKDHLDGLFSRLKSAKLPGGVSFELENNIKETVKLAGQVHEETIEKNQKYKNVQSLEPEKVNNRLIELGLQPSPSSMNMQYYREMVVDNPNLALAGLRIEVEILIKNLATGFELKIDEKYISPSRILKLLLEKHAILESQYQLAMNVLSICNKALHGETVTKDQAFTILESADVLIEDYLAWLVWGYSDGMTPSEWLTRPSI